MFILNDSAKNDSIIQSALASYQKRLEAEEDYRNKVRAGLITHTPETIWNISDRD